MVEVIGRNIKVNAEYDVEDNSFALLTFSRGAVGALDIRYTVPDAYSNGRDISLPLCGTQEVPEQLDFLVASVRALRHEPGGDDGARGENNSVRACGCRLTPREPPDEEVRRVTRGGDVRGGHDHDAWWWRLLSAVTWIRDHISVNIQVSIH